MKIEGSARLKLKEGQEILFWNAKKRKVSTIRKGRNYKACFPSGLS